jgi:hypothetical protein
LYQLIIGYFAKILFFTLMPDYRLRINSGKPDMELYDAPLFFYPDVKPDTERYRSEGTKF